MEKLLKSNPLQEQFYEKSMSEPEIRNKRAKALLQFLFPFVDDVFRYPAVFL